MSPTDKVAEIRANVIRHHEQKSGEKGKRHVVRRK
jgi:hypothetical protein